MGHTKSKPTMRMYGWSALCLLALLIAYPVGCTTDDIGDLLASGAIGSPGGAVRATNGAALQIPEFALNAVYRFELLEVENKPPADHSATTPMIEVKPAEIKFNPSLPASLILPILRDKLPAGRLIWQIKAFRYDGTKWTEIKGVIDDGNSSVTIPITETGIYAAFLGPKPPPDEPEPELIFEKTGETPGDNAGNEGSPEPKSEPVQETTEPATEPGPNESAKETIADTAQDGGTTEPATEPSTEPAVEPKAEPQSEATTDAGATPPPERREPLPAG